MDSTQELLRRMAAGDGTTFEQFYSRFLSVVFPYVFCRVNDLHDTEDIVQDVFAAAFAQIADLQLRSGCEEAWLLRVAHNKVSDLLKKRRRQPEPTKAEWMADVADDSLAPDSVLEGKERLAFIHAVVDELPPNEKAVMVLRYRTVPAMAFRDIGVLLRLGEQGEQAARSCHHRAIRAIRVALGLSPVPIRDPECDAQTRMPTPAEAVAVPLPDGTS